MKISKFIYAAFLTFILWLAIHIMEKDFVNPDVIQGIILLLFYYFAIIYYGLWETADEIKYDTFNAGYYFAIKRFRPTQEPDDRDEKFCRRDFRNWKKII